MSKDHEIYDELAVGWALHALEPEDEAAFSAHLSDCDRCARTVAETVEVMASLAGELPPAEPSAALGQRLREAVERTEQLPADPPEGRRPAATGFPDYEDRIRPAEAPRPVWRRALPALLAAAAVVVIVGLGIWNIVLADSRSQAEATAEAQSRIIAELLEPGRAAVAPVSGEGGDELATVVARDDSIVVIADGLRANDASDSTYVVWGTGSADEPVALGTFDVVHTQIDLRTVGSTQTGLDDFPGYAISLEPGRQAPAAPTDVVAAGEVTR